MWIPVALSVMTALASPSVPLTQGGKTKPLMLTDATTVSRHDLQYDKTMKFRGAPLSALVKARKDSRIVLHFDNGMLIPVRPERASDVFVAVGWVQKDGQRVDTFEAATREKDFNFDPRPVTFKGNKVVVEKGNAGGLDLPSNVTFSPWSRTTSIVSIEVMTAVAWATLLSPQTPTKSASVRAGVGQKVFLSRCVFCHGAGEVGASFGTDILVGLPISDRYSPESLFTQITKNNLGEFEEGLMMPPQHNVTKKDVEVLHAYFRALKASPPKGAAYLGQR